MQAHSCPRSLCSSFHKHAFKLQACRSCSKATIRKHQRRTPFTAAGRPAAAAAAAAATDRATDSCSQQHPSRRRLLQQASLLPLLLPVAGSALPGPARGDTHEPAAVAAAAGTSLQPFLNSQQQYQLSVPGSWEQKGKAGADVLFEDPERRSTSVGVTVSPVRVSSIQQFGDLAAVGQRLLDVERKKESTLGVQLLSSGSRTGAAGATLYDYEYQLDSTRGTKRIFNSVTITGSKLYILNGNYKCDKEAGCDAAEGGDIALLRTIAATFDAGSPAK